MARLIFRFWDSENKKMYYDSKMFAIMGNGEILVRADYINAQAKNVIAMQATGLKDSNGIDIYEGDILQWETDVMGAVEMGISGPVFFDDKYADFAFESDSPNAEPLYESMGKDSKTFNSFIVIGNKYENQSMLEATL